MKLCVRSISILLLLAVPLALCGCAPTTDPNAGVYTCAWLASAEESYSAEEIYPEGCSLELVSGGEALLSMNGSCLSARWELAGEELLLDVSGLVYRGVLSNGAILIGLDGGLEHCFMRSNASEPERAAPVGPLPGESLWNGDWYGYWRIYDAEGAWVQLNGQSFDLFGRISVDENGQGSFSLWDERLSSAEPIARLEIIVPTMTETMGIAAVSGGYLWLMDAESGLWPLEGDAKNISGLICLEGARYSDADGGFTFSLYLRPWGWLWDDVPPETGVAMPYFYYDWYLPLIEQSRSMPEKFDPPESVETSMPDET